MESHTPTVFISYSQDSLAFSNRILEFSNKLRSDGIDASIDQYEESPKEGWPKWMERSIKAADFVIVVASKGYCDKSAGDVEPGSGKGVKWESSLIYQYLYNNDSINDKFVPVILSAADMQFIPMPLQGSTYYNVSKSQDYEKLYWRLRGVTSREKPPLGKLRALPKKERKTLYFTSLIDIETWDKAVWRGPGFLLYPNHPPVLLLLFKNEKSGRKIFEDWVSWCGNKDEHDDIKVTIVEGDVKNEAPGYYVVIGTNLEEAVHRAESKGLTRDELLILNITRIIRANPTDGFRMFYHFKAEYQTYMEYYLVPAVINETTGQIKPLFELGIHKQKLTFKRIEDIDENDEDAILLDPNKPFKKYKK